MTTRVPTVKDLRVKLCYICREEERADDPPSDDPPREWTHPCNCTLIAHEQCLLRWIQTSQSTASRAPNALKCPQCGTAYEMESKNTIVLRGLALGNKVLQRLGRYLTVAGVASVVAVIGTSVYACLTAYGAWAVKKFIGDEMFNLILTDDPVNWPWSAYINLPLIPLSLIFARFSDAGTSMIIPLLLVWPPSSPVGDGGRRLVEYWTRPENATQLASASASLTPSAKYWPPPPVFFGLFAFPFLRVFYQRCYAKLYQRLLGTPLPVPRRMQREGLRFDEGPFVIRIRAQFDDAGGQGAGANANAQPPEGQDQADAPAPAPAVAAAADAAAGDNADPNAAVVQAAEQLIEVDASSLGRRIGGALVVPVISSIVGGVLLELARHSRWLRVFLGVREGWHMPLPPWGRFALTASDKTWAQMGTMQQARVAARILMTAFLGGSRTWIDSDPVWWRNGVGFALFVAVKDGVQLLHLWLAKRELESRRVKDRDFSGVDVRELDLLPSFFRRATP
ncbi:hypothetical protein BDN70DRAFT_854759 [Pholiota conissans]|uniref:RING-CH-type domain-containing protein n=1 Tax=Pholiota conissans TaxID=109636 RepID=A0A9P5Z6N7_9AGAR|nr:hypothetical protein BDN70DRAFT_854759 [Pholiota conissans]